MEKNKIGIIGAGTGALPPEILRMAEGANVEIVELDKDFSPTDIPQFEDRVYTIQPRLELPHIEWCEPVRIQERFPVSFNSCFVYGFGSTHMWVTEPGRKERLIFVEF